MQRKWNQNHFDAAPSSASGHTSVPRTTLICRQLHGSNKPTCAIKINYFLILLYSLRGGSALETTAYLLSLVWSILSWKNKFSKSIGKLILYCRQLHGCAKPTCEKGLPIYFPISISINIFSKLYLLTYCNKLRDYLYNKLISWLYLLDIY
jgi:hypothetical protein